MGDIRTTTRRLNLMGHKGHDMDQALVVPTVRTGCLRLISKAEWAGCADGKRLRDASRMSLVKSVFLSPSQ